MKSRNEIFRHLRPLELSQRGELVPQRNGGISFLCLQKEDSSIDYWVYLCPLDAGFSAKAAVSRLRESSNKADPWGTFVPSEDPLLLQLSGQIGKSDLPSRIPVIWKEIVLINMAALEKQTRLFPSVQNIYGTET